ncbi:hypothetical protein [Streptomyces turgidiscabies]|uniref:Uncharacterized protein n=1 Tax=Streptomyces turgidiscabies TaxID=85558 RepID=A0ABU0RWB2_9ACTN|nr:hypothetical protein [Streptomyces turgidiscabies]MDQ0936274.1 hypothetical protein [Streptomyces turgidiscabies]
MPSSTDATTVGAAERDLRRTGNPAAVAAVLSYDTPDNDDHN